MRTTSILACTAAVFLAGAAAGIAKAADQPVYRSPPAWVRSIPIPDLKPGREDGGVQVLLQNVQTRFGTDGNERYEESAIKLRTAQALAEGGNVILSWRPDVETLIIHRMNIIRGGQVIDLLGGGKNVTVLRRETNLEMSMLDGALTATVQPEGLRVGDVVDLAYTREEHDPVMKGRSEGWAALSRPGIIGRAYFRATWPKSTPMQFRATDGMGKSASSEADGRRELVFDLNDIEAPQAPRGAPRRYGFLASLQLSDFPAWADVSALSAPLYEKAASLGPASPLHAEIDRIKAASPDPKVRAAAALKLVEEQVRYLFLGLNNGGYIPADADATWTRRFGDCKAKTALLLALLNGLGIEAQPVLVNTETGDGLNERLPSMAAFDHVAVRARIGGKSYWLDGTRIGDVSLDDLSEPNFHWGLPVQASGGALVALAPTIRPDPLFESHLTLTLGQDLDKPATAHAEHVFRDDAGLGMQVSLESLTRSDLDRAMRNYWRKTIPWLNPTEVKFTHTEAHQVTLSVNGEATMTWAKDTGGLDVFFDDSEIGFDANYEREPGPWQDAPYAVAYPAYIRRTVTVKLPDKGAGFQPINAFDVDRVAAGIAYKRTTRLDGGVLTIDMSQRAVGPEVSWADAKAAIPTLRDWAIHSVGLRRLSAVAAAASDEALCDGAGEAAVAACTKLLAKAGTDPGKRALAYSLRGWANLRANALAAAIADQDQAIALNPKFAGAFNARGVAEYQARDLTKAVEDYNAAIRLDPSDHAFWMNRATAYAVMSKRAEAIADYSEAIKRQPASYAAHLDRSSQYFALGQWDAAIQDLTEALNARPGDLPALGQRARAHASKGELDLAIADYDAVIRATPGDWIILRNRGLVYASKKDHARAIEDFTASLKSKPDYADALNSRGFSYQQQGQSDLALADYSAALKISPDHRLALGNRANVLAARGDYPGAVADRERIVQLDPGQALNFVRLADIALTAGETGKAEAAIAQALKVKADEPGAFEVRAAIHFAKGDVKAALADLEKVSDLLPNNAVALNSVCWQRATHGVDLDVALARCDAALKLQPNAAPILDSRGLVHFRRGEYQAALGDLDAALKIAPKQAASLYVRGLVDRKLDRSDAAQADFATARAINPKIDETYLKMGLSPDRDAAPVRQAKGGA